MHDSASFGQKCLVALAATALLGVLALAYSGYLSPVMVISLADLRLCM